MIETGRAMMRIDETTIEYIFIRPNAWLPVVSPRVIWFAIHAKIIILAKNMVCGG